MNIYQNIQRLIQYGIEKNLIEPADEIYVRNQLLALFHLTEFKGGEMPNEKLEHPQEILDELLDFAYEKGILKRNTITYRDMLDTRIMNCFVSKPSEVIGQFARDIKISPETATHRFYQMSIASNYIRRDRMNRNVHWKVPSKYGILDITINLSKPEKDPRDIEEEKNSKEVSYPQCLLCKENVGYAGRLDHPPRQNHRMIPLSLSGENWFLQYSPYVYYNEHAIVLKEEHVPMKISRNTFERLLDFIDIFPHYFLGANADLPLVGGSILNHDHFQGGRYEFAMERAPILKGMVIEGFPDIEAGIVKWPLSVLRIRSKNKSGLVELADRVLQIWRSYEDPRVHILPYTDQPHNTITPICRYRKNKYELDLTLRNNRRSREHPQGIFHPHGDLHHIKKENIGLIEVMGLAVLPARLLEEFELLRECFQGTKKIHEYPELEKHKEWLDYLKEKYKEKSCLDGDLLKHEVGKKFERILEDAGVFKQSQEGLRAFEIFIRRLGR